MKMNCQRLLLTVAVLVTLFLSAQNKDGHAHSHEGRSCGIHKHYELMENNPEYAADWNKRNAKFESAFRRIKRERRLGIERKEAMYIIPVAVHFEEGSEADRPCLEALAQSQIDVINADYTANNSEINKWEVAKKYYPGVKMGKINIKFVIATKNHPKNGDPDVKEGKPLVTIGKGRGVGSNFTSSFPEKDPTYSGYMNFIVRRSPQGPTVLGHSALGGDVTGGGAVVMNLHCFGTGNGCGLGKVFEDRTAVKPKAPSNLGRTVTHELGHFFTLHHVFGKNTNYNGCIKGDDVDDTPAQRECNYGSPELGLVKGCDPAEYALFMNYMDYVDDSAMFMFTEGQADRMKAWLSVNYDKYKTGVILDCDEPTNVSVSDIKGSSVKLKWNAPNSAPENGYQYYISTSNIEPTLGFTGTVEAGVTEKLITKLSPETTYYAWVRSKCSSDNSSTSLWVPVDGFTTRAQTCGTPIEVTLSNIGSTEASLEWKAPTSIPEKGFEYYYSTISSAPSVDASVNSVVSGTTKVQLTELEGDTEYYVWVRSVCSSTDVSKWSQVAEFKTNKQCALPGAWGINSLGSTYIDFYWEASSSNPENGYDYYVGMEKPNKDTPKTGSVGQGITHATVKGLIPDGIYYISVRSKCSDNDRSPWTAAQWPVYTDFMGCGVAKVLETTDITNGSAVIHWEDQVPTAPLNGYDYYVGTERPNKDTPITGSVDPGVYMVKVNELEIDKKYYVAVKSKCTSFKHSPWSELGEFVTGNVQDCNKPSKITYSSVTTNSASIKWVGSSAQTYEYHISQNTKEPSSGTPINGTSINLTSLKANTKYYVFVRSLCSDGQKSLWSSIAFTTSKGKVDCNKPLGLKVSNVKQNSVTVSWVRSLSSTKGYEYFVGESNVAPQSSTSSTTSVSANIGSLKPNTKYYVFVRSLCSDGEKSSWSSTSFTTLERAILDCKKPLNLEVSKINETSAFISWEAATSGSLYYECKIVSQDKNKKYTSKHVINKSFLNVNNLFPGRLYSVQVRAKCSATDVSDWSDVIKFTTKKKSTVCKAPEHLDYSNLNATSVTLTWSNSSSSIGHEYYVSEIDKDPSSNQDIVRGVSVISFNDLKPGTVYFFFVRSIYNDDVRSSWSKIRFVTKKSTVVKASIFRKFNNTLFFDNNCNEGNYVRWEWYKNGVLIPGAVKSYYFEKYLDGKYHAVGITDSNVKVMSNVLDIDGTVAYKPLFRVYPNPLNKNELCNVRTTISKENLVGSVLSLHSIDSRVFTELEMNDQEVQLKVPDETGMFIVRLTLKTGQVYSFNILVK